MKKKIFVIALAVCLIVLSIAGSSIAYFTDTDEVTNVFTIGDVQITLSEYDPTAGAMKDISTIAKNTDGNVQYSNVYPTQVIQKSPTITNTSANDAVYTGAIITINGANSLMADEAAVKAVLTGGAIAAGNTSATTKIVRDDTANTITIYVILNNALPKDQSVELFESVAVPANWGNDQMATFKNVSITVNAYATQTAGFSGDKVAITAITTAFAGDWVGYPTN